MIQPRHCVFQAAMECAIDYAQKREAFGQPIAKQQMIQVGKLQDVISKWCLAFLYSKKKG